ncbi:MAG: hypothetical protein GXO90_02525 [FCB group bacterium]|nr:hypothetical protein [FCB group bacterium]
MKAVYGITVAGILLLAVSVARDRPKPVRKIPQVIQTGTPRAVRLAPKWDPVSGRLLGSLEPLDLETGRYFQGRFDGEGRLSRVRYLDEERKPVYEIRLNRGDRGFYQDYVITFYQRGRLTDLYPDLIAPDLSTFKKGWQCSVKLNTGYLPKSFVMTDAQGIRYYFYSVTYPKTSNTPGERWIISQYFRSDSTRVGSRELTYRSGEGLVALTVRDGQNRLLRKEKWERDYSSLETFVTVMDSTGRVLERRIIPGLE